MSRHYLDHAASTPLRAEAIEAMAAQFGRAGNPSSLHGSGRAARVVVEEAREEIAAAVGADPREVIFTSGGTEADNLAVKGAAWAGRAAGREVLMGSAIEHHAVLDPLDWFASSGTPVVRLGVDDRGRLDLEQAEAALDQHGDATALVSVMWANNEVGTVQPVPELVALAHRHGAVTHSDAVQAFGHLPLDFAASGLDALSVTAHKLGGPVGVGALVARRDLGLVPVQHGGGQERDVRSGTLDVAGVAGFAAAVRVASAEREAEAIRLRRLRDRLTASAAAVVPDAVANHGDDGLPGVAHLSFAGALADDLLLLLDAAGIDCSAGSACSAGVTQGSHVLLAMGRTPAQARGALRFSLGHSSTDADVDALLAALPAAVTAARAAGPAR